MGWPPTVNHGATDQSPNYRIPVEVGPFAVLPLYESSFRFREQHTVHRDRN